MNDSSLRLLKGTLDVLILKTVSWGPAHGYAISRWIRESSADDLVIEEGALYPALHRLEERGWLDAEWGITEKNRRAKFYRLTTAGRRQLAAEVSRWSRYANVVQLVLNAATAG